jgi:hypothetical protein
MQHIIRLIFAMAFLSTPLGALASQPTEFDVRGHSWGKETLVIDAPDGAAIQLLVMANGNFPICEVSTAQGGGMALIRKIGKPLEYGCWWSIQRESDNSVWIKISMNSGSEILLPITAFKKRPYNSDLFGPPDLWSEQNYQNIGRRISEHIRSVNHRIRVVTALEPSFDDQQKMAAVSCLKVTSDQLQQYLKVVEIIQEKHGEHAKRWASGESLTDAEASEKRDDIGILVDMADALALRTYKLDTDLWQCLKSKNVPFQ